MLKLKAFYIIFITFIFLTACQTIKEKTNAIVEKENQKLSKFIGRPLVELKNELGNPDDDYKNEKGNLEFVYKTKKYGIPCERKFEIDNKLVVIGFVSNGCF
tara:strand:+ start:696 stop:1001 length:306 start_codon:yes stop_codon:yes gene_type:complete